MFSLTIVIFKYLFYGDSIIVNTLFYVNVVLSTIASYIFFKFISWLEVDNLLLFLEKKNDSSAVKK